MTIWQLSSAVNLRPEAFGGMAFHRERGITLEVDAEAYRFLCEYLAPRTLPPPGHPAAGLVPQLVRMGFLRAVEEGHSVAYCTKLADDGRKVSTIEVRRAAIAAAHRTAGVADPTTHNDLNRNSQPLAQRLSAQSAALVVKNAARAASLDYRGLSGHSLRAGFVTEAHKAGADTADIMAQTGHKSTETVRGYIRDAGLGAGKAMLAAFSEASNNGG